MKIYERLSQVFDLGWGTWTEQCSKYIEQLLIEFNKPHAKVLDIACGTGILAINLARKGYFVHGIDISPEMVAKARSKSAGIPNVSFVVDDMTGFRAQESFDLVTCTFDSLNYLTDLCSVKAMLHCVASSLCESGLFMFDSNTEPRYIEMDKGSKQVLLDRESFTVECKYDSVKKQATTVFSFSDGSTEVHVQRPYDLLELGPALSETGFEVLKTASWFDNRSYNADSGSFRFRCGKVKVWRQRNW